MQQEPIDIKYILGDKRKVAYVCSFIALGFFAYILLVRHDIGDILRSNREFDEAGKNLKMLKDAKGDSAYLAEFKALRTSGQDANALINTVMAAAKNASVVVGSLKPLASTDVKGYSIMRVTAEGEAPYSDFLRFIDRMERFEARLYIEECEVTMSGNTSRQFMPGRGAGRSMNPINEAPPTDSKSADVVKFKLVLASITVAR